MSIDITVIVRRAAARADGWTGESATQWAEAVATDLDTWIEWDSGAGETWVRVLEGQEVVALVSVTVPLAFVRAGVRSPTAVDSVAVDAFDADLLSCELDALGAFPGMSEILDQDPTFDPEAFTPQDLWFVTV